MTDKPIYWVQYALTWATGTPCIANGNTWEESRVLDSIAAQRELEKRQMAELDVILDEYISKLPTW